MSGITTQLSHGSNESGDSGLGDTQENEPQDVYTNTTDNDYDHDHDKLIPSEMKNFTAIRNKHRAPQEYTELIGRPEDCTKVRFLPFNERWNNDPGKESETKFGGDFEEDSNDGDGYCPPSEQSKHKAAKLPLRVNLPAQATLTCTENTRQADQLCNYLNKESKLNVPLHEVPSNIEMLSNSLPHNVSDKLTCKPQDGTSDLPLSTSQASDNLTCKPQDGTSVLPLSTSQASDNLTCKPQDGTSVLPLSTSQASDDCTWDSSESEADDNNYGGVIKVHQVFEDDSSDEEHNTSG